VQYLQQDCSTGVMTSDTAANLSARCLIQGDVSCSEKTAFNLLGRKRQTVVHLVSKGKRCKMNAQMASKRAAVLTANKGGHTYKFHAVKHSIRDAPGVRRLFGGLTDFLTSVCPKICFIHEQRFMDLISTGGRRVHIYFFYKTKDQYKLGMETDGLLGFAIFETFEGTEDSIYLHLMGTIGNSEGVGTAIIEWLRVRYSVCITLEGYEHNAKFYYRRGFLACDSDVQKRIEASVAADIDFKLLNEEVNPFPMYWSAKWAEERDKNE